MKDKKIAYRHGDVVITKIISRPKEVKKLKHLILARGEVTGHAHRITKGEARLYEKDNILYLNVSSDTAALTHEEHAQIDIPAGDYEIRIQREYGPDGWYDVQD